MKTCIFAFLFTQLLPQHRHIASLLLRSENIIAYCALKVISNNLISRLHLNILI